MLIQQKPTTLHNGIQSKYQHIQCLHYTCTCNVIFIALFVELDYKLKVLTDNDNKVSDDDPDKEEKRDFVFSDDDDDDDDEKNKEEEEQGGNN